MSFPKAARFQDLKSLTPGPGTYEPKVKDKAAAVPFAKDKRFSDKEPQEQEGNQRSGSVSSLCSGEHEVKPKTRSKKAAGPEKILSKPPLPVPTPSDDRSKVIESHQDELLRLNQLIVMLTKERDDLVSEKVACLKRLESLEAQITEQSRLHGETQAEVLVLEQARSTLESCNNELQMKLSIAAVDKLAVQDEMGLALGRLQSQKDELQVRLDSMEKHLADLSQQKAECDLALSRERQLLISTEDALEAKQQTTECLRERISQLEQEKGHLQALLEHDKKLHTAQLEQEKGRLEVHCEQEKTQLGAQLSEEIRLRECVEQKLQDVSKLLDSLHLDLKSMTSLNEQLSDENAQLKLANREAENEVTEIQRSLSVRDQTAQELEKELLNYNTLKQNAQINESKLEELLQLNSVLAAKLSDQSKLRQQLQALDNIVEKMHDEHSAELTSLGKALSEAQCVALEADLRCQEVKKDMETRLDRERESNEIIRLEYADRIVALQTKVAHLESQKLQQQMDSSRIGSLDLELKKAREEVDQYKRLYEELLLRIEPFKEQLDAYELEKRALQGQTKDWAAEAAKLSQEYAKLLGHQNQKQKIHRISKLQEENHNLKQELMQLRSTLDKQKRSLSSASERIRSLEGRRRFDPSKAFSGAKCADTTIAEDKTFLFDTTLSADRTYFNDKTVLWDKTLDLENVPPTPIKGDKSTPLKALNCKR